MQLAFADLLQVFLKGHPAIHDHRGPKLFARPLLQRIQHLIQAAPVLRIAVEDFVVLGEAITIHDQSHHHLFAIRTLVPRVSSLGLRVGRGLPFEVRRGQVIQIDGVVQVEQRLSFSASARSMASRFGWSRSRLRYSASSASSEKSSCKMSPKAVRRIQSGMACSEEGQIKRFSVITSVNRQARAESPACCKIRFISNWPQSWCPTCTGPASRACSTWTWSGSTVTVDRSPSDPTVLFFLLRAFSTHSWISVEEPDRDSCPCNEIGRAHV